jgi:hypothetical protein
MLLPSFDEAMPFSFVLTSSDPALAVYTELDDGGASPADSVYYFDNLTNHEPGQATPLLHPRTGPVHPLAVKSRVFRHRFDTPITAQRLLVTNVPEGRQVLQADAPGEPFLSCCLDLTSLAFGRYRLHSDDGTELLDFYLSDTPAATIWGVVDIYARGPQAPVPKSLSVIDDNGEAALKIFKLSLTSRKTFWRYFVFAHAAQTRFDNHRVAGGLPGPPKPPPSILFADPVKDRVGGRTAWRFESQIPIKLFERPRNHHQFTITNAQNGAEIALPYANPQSTRIVDAVPPAAGKAYSDIYVQL